MTYQTPGLYIKESNNLPSASINVSTALPVFIGVTVARPKDYDQFNSKVIKISSLEEYVRHFGTSPDEACSVIVDTDTHSSIRIRYNNSDNKLSQIMYYNLQMYFNNGGGICYIMPLISPNGSRATPKQYIDALPHLEKTLDITLIVLTDAAYYLAGTELKDIYREALAHCAKMQNRFVIFDVAHDDINANNGFKTIVGSKNLKYGAAYTPYLNTNLSYINHDNSNDNVNVRNIGLTLKAEQFSVQYSGDKQNVSFELLHKQNQQGTNSDPSTSKNKNHVVIVVTSELLSIETKPNISVAEILTEWDKYQTKGAFELLAVQETDQTKAVKEQPRIPFSRKGYFSALSQDKVLTFTYAGSSMDTPVVEIKSEKGIDATNVIIEGDKLTIYCKANSSVNVLVKDIENALADEKSKFSVSISNSQSSKSPAKIGDGPQVIRLNEAQLFTGFCSGILVSQITGSSDKIPKVEFKEDHRATKIGLNVTDNVLTITIGEQVIPKVTPRTIYTAWKKNKSKGAFTIQIPEMEKNVISKPASYNLLQVNNSTSLRELESTNSYLYNKILAEMKADTIRNFPPSGAIAGIYARNDQDRGVWQSPANVSFNSVMSPVAYITSKEQDKFNIDQKSGKSINVIRTFPSKGTLVWGARTLAGNDNHWRYIGVRRLFLHVESRIRTGLESFVFEPNNVMTWLKVRAVIEPFLDDLWQEGALMGESPEEAFFVNLGLGSTMEEQDIIDGRMKINIGLAVFQPAEFIVVEFSQLIQK